MEMISPVAPRTCRLLGLTRSTVTLCEPEMDDISYDDRLRNLTIAARTSPVASAYAGAAASGNTAPSANKPTTVERVIWKLLPGDHDLAHISHVARDCDVDKSDYADIPQMTVLFERATLLILCIWRKFLIFGLRKCDDGADSWDVFP